MLETNLFCWNSFVSAAVQSITSPGDVLNSSFQSVSEGEVDGIDFSQIEKISAESAQVFRV